MKDYLSSPERDELISLMHLTSDAARLIDHNTLDKNEVSNLKRCLTYGKKVVNSVRERLNPTAQKGFDKTARKSKVLLDLYGNTEIYSKKKLSDITKSYEENRDYYKLVELILHYNCRNCEKKCCDCEIYPEFVEHCIPEFTGVKHAGKCQYSYKIDK